MLKQLIQIRFVIRKGTDQSFNYNTNISPPMHWEFLDTFTMAHIEFRCRCVSAILLMAVVNRHDSMTIRNQEKLEKSEE